MEDRFEALKSYVDWIHDDQLDYHHQLWVTSIETIFVVFGGVIILSLIGVALGVQSLPGTISYLDRLVDIMVGMVAVISFLTYMTTRIAERWFDWRWGHFHRSYDDEDD